GAPRCGDDRDGAGGVLPRLGRNLARGGAAALRRLRLLVGLDGPAFGAEGLVVEHPGAALLEVVFAQIVTAAFAVDDLPTHARFAPSGGGAEADCRLKPLVWPPRRPRAGRYCGSSESPYGLYSRPATGALLLSVMRNRRPKPAPFVVTLKSRRFQPSSRCIATLNSSAFTAPFLLLSWISA